MRFGNIEALQARIRELDNIKHIQESLIAAEFQNLKTSLKPISLIRDSLQNIVNTKQDRNELVTGVAEIGLNAIKNKLLFEKNQSFVSALLVAGIQMAMESESGEKIKAYGTSIINNLIVKKQKEDS